VKKNRTALTKLGKAIRHRDADMVSARDNYSGAIEAAYAGDMTRLLNLLWARRELTGDEFDQLADLIEAMAKRKRGRGRNTVTHEAAKIAEAFDQLLADGDPDMSPDDRRSVAANKAVEQIAREYEMADEKLFHDPRDPDKKTLARQVLDLMGRSKDRRHPKPRGRTKQGR
jgi:DNA-binding phage protein